MKVRAIIAGANELYIKTGTMEPGGQTLNVKGETFMVTKIWNKKVGLLRKRYIPYAIAMKGEPRTLAYMDNFDAGAFEAFLTEKLTDLKENDKADVEKVLREIYAWGGPDNQIADIEARPYLDRKFRASPVTPKHLHRAITDPQRSMLMRGRGMDPLILVIILAIVIAAIAGFAIYALVSRPVVVTSPEDEFEVIESILFRIRMWWYG